MVLHSPHALRRILYRPHELGMARAYVLGELTVEGDELAALRGLQQGSAELSVSPPALAATIARAARLGVLGRPLPPPPEEVRLHGRVHSRGRDAHAITHHYDVGNDFYRLLLGESMTYSCARFQRPDDSLEAAQDAKHDLICRKLGLGPGMRLLDVGCGWGGMLLHAASKYEIEGLGVTISRSQWELARKRVADAGLAGRVEIRLQDYRELANEPNRFDAISSIGMFEHVGRSRMAEYFRVLSGLLRPRGRLLNHAISTPGGLQNDPRRSFVARYVFPDGELQDVAMVQSAMQDRGLEVRDVEALREHYALTLRRWVANLEAGWAEAVALAGERRARVWRLHMLGSIVSFEAAEIGVHQVLGVKPDEHGSSGMPLTRAGMV